MILGKNSIFYLLIYLSILNSISLAENKILSAPLINLNELKPSFEEEDKSSKDEIERNIILNQKEFNQKKSSSAKLIGLDKITAKTLEININLGETKKFGPLEIKVLKCGKVELENSLSSVAYLQVKDLSDNQNEKVFIFNGWTFSADSTITPFDHAIYDLQLVNCNNA